MEKKEGGEEEEGKRRGRGRDRRDISLMGEVSFFPLPLLPPQ